MKRFHLLLAIVISLVYPTMLSAQKNVQKTPRPMTIEDVCNFRRISWKQISGDGKWIAVTTEASRGDGDRNGRVPDFSADAKLTLYNPFTGKVVLEASPVESPTFSANSQHLVYVTRSPEDVAREILLRKQNQPKSKVEMPMKSLHIATLGKSSPVISDIDSLRSFKIADKADIIAYQTGEKDSTLHYSRLSEVADSSLVSHFGGVSEYKLSRQGVVCFVDTLGIAVYHQGLSAPLRVLQSKGTFKAITFSRDGRQLAFLYKNPTSGAKDDMTLYHFDVSSPHTNRVANRVGEWIIPEHSTLVFSDNGEYLFFGTAPKATPKDTLTLKRDRANVQVWSWDESEQYTVQTVNLPAERKRTYTAVYDLSQRTVHQVADEACPNILFSPARDAQHVLLSADKAYSRSSMWEGRTRSDYYAHNLKTGQRKLIAEGDYTNYMLSPTGKFAIGYAETDSVWRAICMATGERFDLTQKHSFIAWDEEDDHPNYPEAYGAAGFTAEDNEIILYDRYDIYACPIAPDAKLRRLTADGRSHKRQYRLVRLEPSDTLRHGCPIDLGKRQILRAFDENSKGYAYYSAGFGLTPVAPRILMGGDFMLSTPIKAEQADRIIYTRERYDSYPELYTSTTALNNPLQITNEGKQQEQYIWGTAELIRWTSPMGKQLEGVIYKPAGFDPNKKYPLIVNFYERNANTLHAYHMPAPGRSTPDYHWYNSDGYIIFNPDVRYSDKGLPGEDCVDCVLSGMDAVEAMGFVDKAHIGGTGHSWGGYQMAYLATCTDRFAAIESGAPVVNMFSAYGGIRWATGLARSFQYEHTQSRVGGSPWEVPERYTKNSPLFNLDKVNTPLLIMHNDMDGHVPWYQGIEFFVGLKRLNKPAWMLNYSGEPHWPVRMANRIDFQVRLKAFFDHYLKDKGAPNWMTEGRPAIQEVQD